MPTLLHFFEPKYRLMLRRCLQSSCPAFGMIMPCSSSTSASNLNSGQVVEYGTMLEILSVQMLPDGRSMVEARGVWRFRILEHGLQDGYVVGRIERIDDVPDEDEDDEDEEIKDSTEGSQVSIALQGPAFRSEPTLPSTSGSLSSPGSGSGIIINQGSSPSSFIPPPQPSPSLPLSTRHLVNHCSSFLTQLQTSTAPWVLQRISSTHGPLPDPSDPTFDAATFSFYVGMVLPIDEWEKAKLLPVRSVQMRLKMCVWWIEGLRQNWWFERGCVVL